MQSQVDLNCNSDLSDLYTSLQPIMEIHLVEREDVCYKAGRNLAKAVYREVWNTQNLADENYYGVVISCEGKIFGNANIQLKKPNRLLQSEVFFYQKHWTTYFQVEDSEIAEVSGLAISKDAPTELRKPIIMMLIIGLQNICRIKGIRRLSTVQHNCLLRVFRKSLNLPFYKNTIVQQPAGNIPNDNYWNQKKYPSIYYLDVLSFEIVNICYGFLSYINLLGIQTRFFPRLKQSRGLSYASFVQQWNKDSYDL